MEQFVAAVASGDPTKILSGAAESLETHLIVFAAETSRREGRVERVTATGAAPVVVQDLPERNA